MVSLAATYTRIGLDLLCLASQPVKKVLASLTLLEFPGFHGRMSPWGRILFDTLTLASANPCGMA